MSDTSGLTDHERGCAGREYVCTYGYDEQQDKTITTLTARVAEQDAEIARLREALGKANQIITDVDEYMKRLVRSRSRIGQTRKQKCPLVPVQVTGLVLAA